MPLSLLFALAFAGAMSPPTSDTGGEDAHDHPAHFSGRPGLSFEEAVAGAQTSPGLRGARDSSKILRRGATELPRISSGPQVTVMPGVRLAPPDERAFAIQGQLTQSWNLADLGARQRETARADAEVSEAEARRRDLEARLEAAHCWIALRGVERRLALAREELALATELRHSLEASVAAGQSTRGDLIEADVHLAAMDTHVIELEGQAHDLGLLLALSAGAAPDQPLATVGPDPAPQLGTLAEARRALEVVDRMPAVEVARLQQLQARAMRAQTRATSATQLTTGIAAQREGRSDAVLYGIVGLSFGNLPQRRAQGLAADVAERTTQAQLEEARRNAKADLTQALHEVEHTELLVSRLETARVPAQRELVESLAARRALGEATVADELWARQRLVAARRELADARTANTWALVHAWILVAQLRGGPAT